MLRCVVCGRPFPEGQGIVLSRGNIFLTFHSSRCASKFFRRMIMDAEDIDYLDRLCKKISGDFEEAIKRRAVEKKI